MNFIIMKRKMDTYKYSQFLQCTNLKMHGSYLGILIIVWYLEYLLPYSLKLLYASLISISLTNLNATGKNLSLPLKTTKSLIIIVSCKCEYDLLNF